MGDTDLLNATYAELGKDVFAISGQSSPVSKMSGMTSASTPKPTKLEEQKEKVAASWVTRNEVASSLIKVQTQQVAMEVTQMIEKHYEELEDKLFLMKEELRTLEVGIVNAGTSQSATLTLQRRKSYVKKKLERGTRKLSELEIKMNNNALHNNN